MMEIIWLASYISVLPFRMRVVILRDMQHRVGCCDISHGVFT